MSEPSTGDQLSLHSSVLTISWQCQIPWISICTAGWQLGNICAHRFLKLQLDSRQLLGTNLFMFDFANSGLHSSVTIESMSSRSGKLMVLLMIKNSYIWRARPAGGTLRWQQVPWSHSAKGCIMYAGCWYLLEVCHSAIYCLRKPTLSAMQILRDCKRQV